MLFSVIIPVYMVEEYLVRCIDSVLAQTFTDFEVILVDDGSTDGCPQICDSYAERDPRIHVIHKENGGLVSARNAGIFAAKGEFICYVDGDDWVKPNLLEFVHDRIVESPIPLDMVIFASENVFADHSTFMDNHVQEGYYDRQRLEKEIFPYLLSDRRNGFRPGEMIQGHTWNKPCRRELQRECYVRDERIRMFTDVPMTYECILNCQNVYICNEYLYLYNKTNANSILARGKRNYLTVNFNYLVSYMQERMKEYGQDIVRQLNDFPVSLIIRSAMSELREKPFLEATRTIRERLNQSKILDLTTLKGLPTNPKLMLLLFKLHMDHAAMALCAIRVYQAKKSKVAELQK